MAPYDMPPAQIESIPLPRPNPLREMINHPVFKMFAAYGRQDEQSLPAQLGLADMPEAQFGPRSIMRYNPNEPYPEARYEWPPEASPDVANWDQWLAGLPESGNVEDLRTPREKALDYHSWTRSYRTTPAIQMPLPSDKAPPYYQSPTTIEPFPTPFGGPPE